MKPRILVAEDDDVQRDVIIDILAGAGYAVAGAATAQEALEALRSETVDLLITDLRMPGMDGLELLRQAKGRHRHERRRLRLPRQAL